MFIEVYFTKEIKTAQKVAYFTCLGFGKLVFYSMIIFIVKLVGYYRLILIRLGTKPDEVGDIQLTHPSGLLDNIPCHRGNKLPKHGDNIRVLFNKTVNIVQTTN